MLGEKISETKGKIISSRVLCVEEGRPKLEITLQGEGRILGANFKGGVTYTAEVRQGKVLLGQGSGVLMMEDGEIVTFTGYGAGRREGGGLGASWRGCNFYESSSNKYSRLNGLACVFEHEVDDEGNFVDNVWELK